MIKNFEERITSPEFKRTCGHLNVMQVYLGRLCNLACKHCRMEAGPDRTEIMTQVIDEFHQGSLYYRRSC
ncbi:MAG: hypothetical protein IJT22_04495 [Synergistaceae bacterium]|nr:hypothetical protein [Synergistaceae bacterium]